MFVQTASLFALIAIRTPKGQCQPLGAIEASTPNPLGQQISQPLVVAAPPIPEIQRPIPLTAGVFQPNSMGAYHSQGSMISSTNLQVTPQVPPNGIAVPSHQATYSAAPTLSAPTWASNNQVAPLSQSNTNPQANPLPQPISASDNLGFSFPYPAQVNDHVAVVNDPLPTPAPNLTFLTPSILLANDAAVQAQPSSIPEPVQPVAAPVQSAVVNAVLTQVTANSISTPMAATSTDSLDLTIDENAFDPTSPPRTTDLVSTRKRRKRSVPTPPPEEEGGPINYEDDLWDEKFGESDDFFDTEETVLQRLERLKDLSVARGGMFPVQYFDEPAEASIGGPLRFRSRYSPVFMEDLEILADEPIELSPYRAPPDEVDIYCYPFTPQEVLSKCLVGLEALKATGVFVPMTSELQTERDPIYYKALATLKKTYRPDGGQYKVFGVAYDNPNWALITQIVMKYPIFDGIMIEWIGRQACPWNINQPTEGQIETIIEKAGPIYYFYRLQACEEELLLDSPLGGAFVNPNDDIDTTDVRVEKGNMPKFLKYIFACFHEEGPCYNAFRNFRDRACSDLQRYAFSPYEAMGNLMMHLANETCTMKDHLLYSVV